LNSHCVSINNLYKSTEGPRGEIGRQKGLKIFVKACTDKDGYWIKNQL